MDCCDNIQNEIGHVGLPEILNIFMTARKCAAPTKFRTACKRLTVLHVSL